jgi:hypothetical protein
MLKGVSCRVLDKKVSQSCSQQGDTFFCLSTTFQSHTESVTFTANLPAWTF